jgi:hypothetical protein
MLANGTPRKHFMFGETNASLIRIILVEVLPYHQHPYL